MRAGEREGRTGGVTEKRLDEKLEGMTAEERDGENEKIVCVCELYNTLVDRIWLTKQFFLFIR